MFSCWVIYSYFNFLVIQPGTTVRSVKSKVEGEKKKKKVVSISVWKIIPAKSLRSTAMKTVFFGLSIWLNTCWRAKESLKPDLKQEYQKTQHTEDQYNFYKYEHLPFDIKEKLINIKRRASRFPVRRVRQC